MRLHALLLIGLAGVAGCASTAQKSAVSTEASARPGLQLSRIAMDFTPEAQKQVADDPRFDSALFNNEVIRKLQSLQLLDLKRPADRVAVIRLEEYAVQATSNVVLFGRLRSAGTLAASVRVRDAAGATLQEFKVRAEMPLRIPQRETGKNPLQDLYSQFALLMAEQLRLQP